MRDILNNEKAVFGLPFFISTFKDSEDYLSLRMNKSILLLTFLLFSLFSFGQNKLQETIHLNNGTVVSGTIVEYVPNKTYTIVTADGNKFVFNVSDIAKITWEAPTKSTNATSGSPSKNMFSEGYHGFVETGIGAGMGTYGLDMFKIDFVNGHRFNENVFVGGGVGFRQATASGFPSFIPLYANGRYNLTPSHNVVPFASLSAGVAFNSTDGLNEGGLVINPAVGVHINKFSSFMINASIGYDLMDVPFYEPKTLPDYPFVTLSRRIRTTEAFVFNVGITF